MAYGIWPVVSGAGDQVVCSHAEKVSPANNVNCMLSQNYMALATNNKDENKLMPWVVVTFANWFISASATDEERYRCCWKIKRVCFQPRCVYISWSRRHKHSHGSITENKRLCWWRERHVRMQALESTANLKTTVRVLIPIGSRLRQDHWLSFLIIIDECNCD